MVRVTVHQVIHVLPRMHNGLMPAGRPVIVIRLAPMDLVQLVGVKHTRAHETAERIHSGARRSGSSSTTCSRR